MMVAMNTITIGFEHGPLRPPMHRADATRHRCDGAGDGGAGGEIDVADQPPIRQAVDADVDD